MFDIEQLCGNGILDSGEQCDDGNTTSGDGCSATCQCEGNCGAGQAYQAVDLGTLGGRNSLAYAVNGGQVVGQADTAGGDQHAFRWTEAGGMVDAFHAPAG